jgi:hypothetical protein
MEHLLDAMLYLLNLKNTKPLINVFSIVRQDRMCSNLGCTIPGVKCLYPGIGALDGTPCRPIGYRSVPNGPSVNFFFNNLIKNY